MPSGSGQRSDSSQGPLPTTRVMAAWMMKPVGDSDGRTLFILAAEWRGIEKVDEALAARTGQVLTVRAPAPRAGWP